MITNKSLNSTWKFVIDEKNEGLDKGWQSFIPDHSEDIWVPSCWNELREELLHYEGPAWYYKKLVYKKTSGVTRNILFFHGVNYRCEVWLNGKSVGRHVGGFTPFEIDVTGHLNAETENLIAVWVDSTINDMTSPPIGVDWFNYGGIFRDVSLIGTGESWLDDITVITGMSGEIEVTADIGNYSGDSDYSLSIRICDPTKVKPVYEEKSVIKSPKSVLKLNIDNPRLWSPETPFLYEFELVLMKDGRIVDRWEHKIGIREFSIKDRKILLNGRQINLRGYSKHEEYPMLGRTFCRDIVRKDYELCRQGNANFLRLCHYPHHLGEYEIASETGMLVIAEVPNVNFKKEQFLNTELLELANRQMKETIKYYKNETCIMFWSLFIECKTYEDAAVDFVPKYIKLAKELDPTRFTVHASDIPTQDRTYEYFDVVGVNYWFGWYNGDTLEGCSELMDRISGRYPEKPVLITSGGWEGLPGSHSYKAKVKWSEEAQAEYLEKLSTLYLGKDYIAGQIIWTFNDFRVSPWIVGGRAMWPGRPMEMNYKGVFDCYRRPKLAYYKMQEVFKLWEAKI